MRNKDFSVELMKEVESGEKILNFFMFQVSNIVDIENQIKSLFSSSLPVKSKDQLVY